MNHSYIVVEGAIGCGKSALSRKLAAYFDAMWLSERPEANPFLNQFYLNAANHGLATELWFAMRRSESAALVAAECDKHGRVVSDFLLEKGEIFSTIILSEDERKLYWELSQKVMPQYPAPNLVVYLQASDDTIHQQLKSRDDTTWKLFPEGYLSQINDEYQRFFHLYTRAPVLIANVDDMDFIGNDDHFELLVHAIVNMQGSRGYLNLDETLPA